ncbi:hypothetical protein GHH_c17630 [Geobacillus sp. GHH01]|nr:hypothetical protein [Geobacillus sp. GHH01]AGE22290.1 hypothetical protein GHH_c17630 [Geobacillus sp. GHH01]
MTEDMDTEQLVEAVDDWILVEILVEGAEIGRFAANAACLFDISTL